jgi:hypothetical protein
MGQQEPQMPYKCGHRIITTNTCSAPTVQMNSAIGAHAEASNQDAPRTALHTLLSKHTVSATMDCSYCS